MENLIFKLKNIESIVRIFVKALCMPYKIKTLLFTQTKLRISPRNMQNDGKAVNFHYRNP
jgi:hypothetical protein